MRDLPSPPQLIGVDFTCAPGRRKPITVACGTLDGARLHVHGVVCLESLAAFEQMLVRPGPWLGAFDFPFGLPAPFVRAQGLGQTCAAVIAEVHRRCPTRLALRAWIDAGVAARPAGQRLLHRACDTAMPGARSTSPLQTRYVPVGFMYYEGLSRLVAAGLTLPRLHAGDPVRVAVEGYPGLLAHELVGRRSYKNGADGERRSAREDIVARLEQGRTRLALRVCPGPALRAQLLDDAAGDRLDALLCLVQAAWASTRPDLGLPEHVDPVEGWIATLPAV